MKNKAELLKNYRQYEKLNADMRATVLEIMGHPGATANMVMEVQQKFVRHCEEVRAMRRSMRKLGLD